MNWELVWDIRRAGNVDMLIGLAIAGAIFLAALSTFWLARRKQQRPVIGSFLFVMSLVVMLGLGITTWDRHRLAELLQRGEVQSVEGFVTGHQIWRQARARSAGESQRFNTWETITVGGVQFTWAPDAGEAAFTNSGASKVDFHDGLPARVRWVEDIPGEAHQRRIVSLEVAADYRQAQGHPAPYPSMLDPNTLVPTN